MAVKRSSTTHTSVTKADLTEAIDRIATIFDTKLTETQLQLDTKLTETRLQLERKMDWVRQDTKEQLEGVEQRLTHRIDRVEEGLQSTQTAVLHLSHDMKEVKATLADHGQKLDRLEAKVTQHEQDIVALKESRLLA